MERFFGKSVSKLLNCFKKRPLVEKVPPVFLHVEQNGTSKRMTSSEFEKISGAKLSLHACCDDVLTLEKLLKKTKKLYRKSQLSRQQVWFGSYFKQELTTPFIADVVIRYIDETFGWGVFANRDFQKMEFIAEYAGVIRKSKRSDKENAYCFEYVPASNIKTSFTIDAREQGGISRYINHSQDPNLLSALATLDGFTRVILITSKPLQKGEQLCYDYGPDYWSKRPKPLELP
jgi:hypothetical protein